MHQPEFSPEQRTTLLRRVTASPAGRLILLGAALALTFSILTTMAEAAGLVNGTPFGRLVGNNSSYQILVSDNPDRSGASGLNGSNLSGDVYIFLAPEEGVRQVRFYLDDPERVGNPRQVENLVPFDFAATADGDEAYPFDADNLSDGEHSVTAEVETDSGEVAVVSATFTVGEATGSTDSGSSNVDNDGGFLLFVSQQEDRSDPEPLDGTTQDGDIFVFITPDENVSQVRFFLDDPNMDGKPSQVENLVQYDFAGTDHDNDYVAYAFDTADLSPGEHTITALVKTEDGQEVVTSATFSVGTGAPTPDGSAPSTPEASATPTPQTVSVPNEGDSGWMLALSQSSDRSAPTALDGATVTGDIYVFVAPAGGIGRVRFFVDDPERDGSPYVTEYQPAYDLAATDGDGRAYAFDADALGAGTHTVSAEIDRKTGGTEVVEATFTVGEGGSGSGSNPGTTPTATPSTTPNTGAAPQSGSGSMPSGAVQVKPGDDLQALVNSRPSGTTFYLTAGVHRMHSVKPKDGNTFLGAPGAVMRGSRELTSWQRSGSEWVVGGQSQQGNREGRCESGTICKNPEQLFIDGERLRQVSSRGDVGSGTWYFDYGADRIYIGVNPSGRLVETSVTAAAFSGSASNVTIRGLVIEHYASPAQRGAIHGSDTDGWVVDGNVVQYNHGAGIRIGPRMRVINNRVLHNGQLGVTGVGNNVLVEGNEIAYNNESGYLPQWEAGGTKFVLTRNLVVRDNYVHHNIGPGLWTDIDNIDTLFEGNTVEHNTEQGIKHEISYAAVIRNNVVRYNGFGFDTWLWGGQIVVQDSSDTEVYGNTVVVGDDGDGITGVDQGRGDGKYGPWTLKNLWVHHNDITYESTGANSGVAGACGDNNRFDHNTYRAPSQYQSRSDWEWCGIRTFQGMRDKGQERNGKLIIQ